MRSSRPAILGLLPLLLLAPLSGAGEETASSLPRVPVQTFQLDNGLRVLVVRQTGKPMVAAGWAVHSGSGDERPGASGRAHLLEHLMFHGSRRLAQGELARLYTEAGAVGLNAVTDKDFTVYYGQIPVEKLELWFWIESDRLLAPVLKDVEAELRIVAEERRQRLESTPTGPLADQLQALAWQGHPYAWQPIGRPEDLAAVHRAQAEEHFAAQYRPDRITVALVGDLDLERVRPLAQAYFGRLPRGASSSVPSQTPAQPSAPAERRLEGSCDCAPQARLVYRTVPFGHRDAAALDVLAGLLNGRTGRLYRSLVLGRQIAFSAYAQHEPGRLGGSLSLIAEAKGDTAPAQLVGALEAELSRLRDEPLPGRELLKVKNQITTDAYRRLRDPMNLALRLLIYDAQGDWRHLERWPGATLAVTAEDVRRVAADLTPERRTVGLFARKSR